MGRIGCMVDGYLNDSKFNEPMPWIGIYVAAASLACAMAMAIDAFHGFRYKKLWFPCKFCSLNATTLTLIGVAIKFSVDLNTSMPHRQDQLAKVSSSAFICTIMGNLLPSLGTMENTDLFVNIVALGILVITAIANICIQLGTGVIFVFWIEHGFIMLLMLVLLAITCSLALAVPTTKYYLDIKYTKKLQVAIKECSAKRNLSVTQKFREDLAKYWMMAYTSSSQFVIGRSAPCTASGAFCLLSTLILAEVMLRSYLMPWSFKFCAGESDYKWSTTLVLISQTIAVGIGTISPAFRWFMAINYRCPKKAMKACKRGFRVEKYWIKKLIEWKEQPLDLRICGRKGRKLAHNTKTQLFALCIGMQKGIVLVCKLIRQISVFFVSRFLKLKRLIKCKNSVSSNFSELESEPNPNMKLSRFVMHLEGEEDLVDVMMENNYDATDHWIKIGEKKQPKNLIKLLEKSTCSGVFKGVREFDSDKIPSLDSVEPPNSWALPVVTLTSIAVSLPNIDKHGIKQLVSSVHEGLKYVREVENHLDKRKDLKNIRKAAEIVWLEAELYNKWLGLDLQQMMALQGKDGKEIIETLSEIAKDKFVEFGKGDMVHMNECLREIPSRWPIKVLAANSMYRICQTLLLRTEIKEYECSEKLFEKLSLMISNILGACFTNLQHVISDQCHHSRIEEREQNIRYAVLLFGKMEKILKILEQKNLQGSVPNQLAHIDDWDVLCNQKGQETAFSSSSDLYISIT